MSNLFDRDGLYLAALLDDGGELGPDRLDRFDHAALVSGERSYGRLPQLDLLQVTDARFIFVGVLDDIVADGHPLDDTGLEESVSFSPGLGVKTEISVKMEPLGALNEQGLADRGVGVMLP